MSYAQNYKTLHIKRYLTLCAVSLLLYNIFIYMLKIEKFVLYCPALALSLYYKNTTQHKTLLELI